MKKAISVVMTFLLVFPMFAVLIPKASASTGLVGYWKFDEGFGNTAADSSGNGNNGTLENGPAWVNGEYGKALSFDGVDDYVYVIGNTDLNPYASNWTISAWVNIAKLSYGMYGGGFPECYGFVIACKRQEEHGSSLTLLVQGGTSATSQAKFAFVWDDFNRAGGAESTLMNVTGWHYVVGVRRGGQLFVYVDGAEFGPNNFGPPENQITPTTEVSSSTPIHFAHHGAWATYHNGTIDEVRIYNRALSKQEIEDLHDIAVVGLTCVEKTVIGVGYSTKLNVTVTNEGSFVESFDLALTANQTVSSPIAVATMTISSLLPGELRTVTFMWSTTGWAKGNYTISAVADTVLGETDTADNTCNAGWVKVTIPGDTNGDQTVNVLDLILIANHLGHTNGDGHTPYSSDWYKCMNTDVQGDNAHNVLDLILCANHLGQHW